jgi:hypothetical protein
MKNLILILAVGALLWACSQPKPEPEAEAPAAEVKPAPVEIGDVKFIDVSKEALKGLAAGNVDGFLAGLSDDAKFFWNYGDSLVGKAAITNYWKDRRTNVIDTLIISGDVWLVINANEAPRPDLATGTWVFGWYTATAKYKATGKSMTQGIHQVSHFNESGKVDVMYQYLDRALIQAALKK